MEVFKLRKYITTLLVFFLSVLLLLTSCSNRANPKIQPKVEKRAEAIQSGTVKVSSKEIKTRSDTFDVDIRIPQIRGLKDQQLENEINKDIMEDAQEEKRELEKEAKEEAKEYKRKGREFRPYSIKGDYKVKQNKNNILSLYMTYLKYTGGAHPVTEPESLNLNIKTGKKLKLKDFFKPNQDYKKVLEREILAQIKKEKDRFYDDAAEKVKSEIYDDDLDFYVEDGNLVIYFEEYEIAPHSSGIPKFKVPIQKMPK